MTDLDLGEYLPYLLNRAGTRIATAFAAAVREHGVTLPMWRVLAALHQREDQRLGELAESTSIEVSTLSRLVGSLQDRGLVERRRSSGDGRSVTVGRTTAGRALTARIIPLARRYEDVALAGFSAAEADALKGMLRRLYTNMAALHDAEPVQEREQV